MRFFKGSIILILLGCNPRPTSQPLFTDITESTDISFNNKLVYTEELNPYTYRNFYNGAGVAVGDINNDGLADIYFAGNQVSNKLYLNQGDFKFKDITDSAGVNCADVWSTGVTMVDINADGFLDIYVCKSGDPNTPNRQNELFINNGNLTFSERSGEYGLDVKGLSVHAAFFDYDKDGDLDCYLLTNSVTSISNYESNRNQRNIPDFGGNKLFRNDQGKFIDVTQKAGIYNSSIGFGLGITLADFNNDSWTDIFISNDFFERDYLYINNKKGGFNESLTKYFQSISMGSMGADAADLNNDGKVDLFVTEMLPDSLNRKKTKAVYENWDKYQENIKNGYYYQFARNVLQENIGDSSYAEIGRMSGLAATEWSWGALLFDMDDDGRRDIFIANGIYKDLLDRDYLTYTATDENIREMIKSKKSVIKELVNKMPSSDMSNYAFKNLGEFNFQSVTKEWGLDRPMYSNGSAYGDLDNDGDLDLVVNNLNMKSVVFRNNTDTTNHKSLNLLLKTNTKNSFAVGAKVFVYCGNNTLYADNFTSRGFQSSVDPRVHIGLGQGKIDSLVVRWPAGGYTTLYNPYQSKLLMITKEKNLSFGLIEENVKSTMTICKVVSDSLFKHKGSHLNDFTRDRLLPMMYSNESPKMSKGDIDNDGKSEIYIGGGKDQPAKVIKYDESGSFISYSEDSFKNFRSSEETGSVFFDADNDGDLDLYVASGGRFYPKTSTALMDRLFINDGKGRFSESQKTLPFTTFISTSSVVPFDFDNDGDLDLFIGERFHPFFYGLGGGAFLFENDGNGNFQDVTSNRASDFTTIGMVTDALSVDIDSDGWKDIILVGDWMPIKIFKNLNGNFKDISSRYNLQKTQGWYHEIQSGDFNKDGKPDFILGNHGRNSFFKQSDRMYVNDFDLNGSIEQIFCTINDGKYYPVLDKDELVLQIPNLKKQLTFYKDYASKSIDDLFDPDILKKAKVFQVNILNSLLLISEGDDYKVESLPSEAQYAPIYSIIIDDFNGDGVLDVIAGGNRYNVKPQFGKYDASSGWYFEGNLNSQNKFEFRKGKKLGIPGEIRDLEEIKINETIYLIVAKYDDDVEVYKICN